MGSFIEHMLKYDFGTLFVHYFNYFKHHIDGKIITILQVTDHLQFWTIFIFDYIDLLLQPAGEQLKASELNFRPLTQFNIWPPLSARAIIINRASWTASILSSNLSNRTRKIFKSWSQKANSIKALSHNPASQ